MSVRLMHVVPVPMTLGLLAGQLDHLRAHGLDLYVVSSPDAALEEFSRRERIPVAAVHLTRSITPVRDLRAVWRLRRVMREARPTIVHGNTAKAGLLAMLAATLARVPVRVYHMRGLPLLSASGRRRSLLRWTERLACRLAHRVICVSHSLREVALAERLCAEEKIVVLAGGSSNGVDANGRFDPARLPAGTRERTREELGIPRDALVIGFVGRVVREKGVVELTEAWQELREAFPSAHLMVVGPAEAQDAVPRATEEALRADARVHLVDFAPDVPRYYAAMDVVALPSYREGLPNVALETGAMGLPLVATEIPGCVDAVRDGITGVLVPPRDSESLREALATYLGSAELRERHGAAAREHVAVSFRREVIWDAMLQEYRRLLRAHCSYPAAGLDGSGRRRRAGETPERPGSE